MQTTLTLSANLHVSPFEIFEQDADEVILLINFYIRRGGEQNTTGQTTIKTSGSAQTVKRVRVNDKTASGGWF